MTQLWWDGLLIQKFINKSAIRKYKSDPEAS